MRQSLQLKLGQRLTMTPQLQQAIRLLQLSTLELRQEIQEALESNLMLEQSEESTPDTEAAAERTDSTADDEPQEDALVAERWDEGWSGEGSGGDGWDFNQTADDRGGNLRDHLLWQLELSPISDEDRLIAVTLIDAVDGDGYLSVPLDQLLEELREQLPEIETAEIEAVLHRIQRFDPVGVAARDLQETLQLQLAVLHDERPPARLARTLVGEHMPLLCARDYATLRRRLKCDEQELAAALRLIQRLNPRPGGHIGGERTEYIAPDVFVRKSARGWQVELSPGVAPRLRINSMYEGLIRRADNSRDNETLKQHLQEARWFIKSLQSRNETLLKVAGSIVERQQAFFEYGEEAMQPMVLREIAEAVSMHESTISRVTNQKYMHTPRGVFEFKYFFSSHVSTADGGECSATAIQAMIRKLVAAEDPRRPLSDAKLAEKLLADGINVARRTVAKYREALAIPPSNERKRLI